MASSNQNSLPLTTAGGNNHVGLPAELLASIISHLPNRDIKSLRLTCGFFRATAKLRLNRIFLSANPRDVEVFRAIADHETFRKGIIEIIWDDAVIREPKLEEFDSEEEIENRLAEEADGCPLWFSRECEENNFNLKGRYQYDILDRPDRAIAAQLPLRESWAYFRQLRSCAAGCDFDGRRRRGPATWTSALPLTTYHHHYARCTRQPLVSAV